MKTIIYISGPMDGKPGKNFDNFMIAATAFRDAGYEVLNPAEWGCYPDGEVTHQWYLDRDLDKLQEAYDAGHRVVLYMLRGWEASRGANQEKAWIMSKKDRTYFRLQTNYQTDEAVAADMLSCDWAPDDGKDKGDVYPPSHEAFPKDAAERKTYPVFKGLLDYFPHACAAVAHHSHVSNEQHNPGEPMHWAREKSVGNGDQIVRHLMEGDYAAMAWRALELLERSLTPEEDTHGS